MPLLGWVLAVLSIVFLSVAVLFISDGVRSRFSTLEQVLRQVSDKGSARELRTVFDSAFNQRLNDYRLSTEEWKRVQRERTRKAREIVRWASGNIDCLQLMAAVRCEEDGELTSDPRTKALKVEMIYRATRCRVLVRSLQIRLMITSICGFVLWKMSDPGMSEICEAIGGRLASEYEQLVGASLAFCRKHGDHYYEVLLFALDSIVICQEPATGEQSV